MYHFGGPYNKDYSLLGSILGSLCFGKVPFWAIKNRVAASRVSGRHGTALGRANGSIAPGKASPFTKF